MISKTIRQNIPNIPIWMALAAVYFITGKLGLSIASVHPSATAVWAPTAISITAFLFLGLRVWPGVFLGAFLVNETTAGNVLTSIGIAAGNTLEGWLAAFLTRTFAHGRKTFDRMDSAIKYVFLAAVPATAVGAVIGVTSLSLGGFAPWDRFSAIALTWWLGDAAAALLLAPLPILWLHNPRPIRLRSRLPEFSALVALFTVVCLLAFTNLILPFESGRTLALAIFPLFLWAVVRFEPHGVALCNLLMTGIGIYGALSGSYAAYPGLTPAESLIRLQASLAFFAVPNLVFAAAILQLERSRREIQDSHSLLDSRVRERTTELAAAKEAAETALKELEAFSYSVSHDLRAPLRAVDGFSQAIIEDYGDRLDQIGRDHLQRVREGCQQMGILIDDLLGLSRLARSRLQSERVDLSELAREIAGSMDQRYPNRRVAFEVKDGLMTSGDPGLLRIALDNLLDNAWKFTSRTEHAHVYFGGAAQNGAPTYFVKDDGAGFDPAFSSKLFNPFQRLHTTEEFPGNGIGLATVHRIVQRHGGKVWAEGAVGRGATFYFSLDTPGKENSP